MTMTSQMPLTPSVTDKLVASREDKKRIEETVAWVKSQYDACRNQRSGIERQWYTNMAFYAGLQNIEMVKAGNGTAGYKFRTPPAPYWRARPVINKIRPIIRKEVSKLTNQRPSATIVPASSDDKDLFAARAGEEIWESQYDGKKIQKILRKAVWWSSITGTGYIKNWWDVNAVDVSSDQMGDIAYESVTPFHVFVPDLIEEELESQPYIIHASTKSVEWVKLHYSTALDGKEVKPNTKAADEIIQNGFLNLLGANDAKPDAVLCLEMWVKPGSFEKFPNGALLTVIGDQLVQASDMYPYSHGQYPFAKITHIASGKFYGDSVITDLIPLQREINRTHGQIIEAKNRMAKPQLIATQGSVNPAQITTEPGQVILVKPGFPPPSPLPLVALPSYVMQELDNLNLEMGDISGQHEVSKGQVPPGVTAATAISYLQEQDDSMLHTTIESIEECIEKTARHTLCYVKDYWDTPRIVKVTGEDGSFDTMMFQSSDLRDNTDIRVEAGSALPTSKAAKQAFIMDLMNMGYIDPDKGLELMEIGGVQKLYDSVKRDTRQAQRENLRMQAVTPDMLQEHMQMAGQEGGGIDPQTGEPLSAPPIVPVNSWDNHQAHIETHNNFRKSQSFEVLPEYIKAVVEEHVRGHILAMGTALMGGQPTPDMLKMPTLDQGATNSKDGAVAEKPMAPEEYSSEPTLGV